MSRRNRNHVQVDQHLKREKAMNDAYCVANSVPVDCYDQLESNIVRIDNYLDDTSPNWLEPVVPLVVAGRRGSGKTTLLATWVAQRREQGNNGEMVFAHFGGCSRDSYNVTLFLHRLIARLKTFADLHWMTMPDREDTFAVRMALPRFLKAAVMRTGRTDRRRHTRVIIVVDNVHYIRTEDGEIDISWLPKKFPAGVRVVLAAMGSESDLEPATGGRNRGSRQKARKDVAGAGAGTNAGLAGASAASPKGGIMSTLASLTGGKKGALEPISPVVRAGASAGAKRPASTSKGRQKAKVLKTLRALRRRGYPIYELGSLSAKSFRALCSYIIDGRVESASGVSGDSGRAPSGSRGSSRGSRRAFKGRGSSRGSSRGASRGSAQEPSRQQQSRGSAPGQLFFPASDEAKLNWPPNTVRFFKELVEHADSSSGSSGRRIPRLPGFVSLMCEAALCAAEVAGAADMQPAVKRVLLKCYKAKSILQLCNIVIGQYELMYEKQIRIEWERWKPRRKAQQNAVLCRLPGVARRTKRPRKKLPRSPPSPIRSEEKNGTSPEKMADIGGSTTKTFPGVAVGENAPASPPQSPVTADNSRTARGGVLEGGMSFDEFMVAAQLEGESPQRQFCGSLGAGAKGAKTTGGGHLLFDAFALLCASRYGLTERELWSCIGVLDVPQSLSSFVNRLLGRHLLQYMPGLHAATGEKVMVKPIGVSKYMREVEEEGGGKRKRGRVLDAAEHYAECARKEREEARMRAYEGKKEIEVEIPYARIVGYPSPLLNFRNDLMREAIKAYVFGGRESRRQSHWKLSQYFSRLAPCQRKIEELLLHFEQTENWYSFKCALVNVELFRIWWHPVNRPDLMSAWRVLTSNTMASGSYDIVQEYSQAICTYTDKHGHDPAKLTEFMYDLSCFMREFCINLTKQRAILEEAAEKKQAAARKHKRATGIDLEEEDDGAENPLLAGMPTLLRTEVPSIGFILEEAGALAPLLSEIDRNLQQELGKAGANKLSRARPLIGIDGSFGSDSDQEGSSFFDDSCMPVADTRDV